MQSVIFPVLEYYYQDSSLARSFLFYTEFAPPLLIEMGNTQGISAFHYRKSHMGSRLFFFNVAVLCFVCGVILKKNDETFITLYDQAAYFYLSNSHQ